MSQSKNERPTWVEIDQSALRSNIASLRKNISSSARLMAVVKADAYGHDSILVARTAIASGATCLGVATPHEGEKLRSAGIEIPIVVLSPTLPSQARSLIELRLTPSITSIATARALEGSGLSIHIKINTGMNRSGVDLPEALEFIRSAGEIPGVAVEGVFSHFAGADDADRRWAYDQFDLFENLLRELGASGLRPPIAHICNTAAVIDMPEMALDMVRVGLGMYGLYPSNFVSRRPKLLPVLSWKTKILERRFLQAGVRVGYNGTYVTENPAWVALLPVGYADGYRRALSNKGEVIIGGKRRRIAGRVSMDLIIVDCGDDAVNVEDEAVLIGRQGEEEITADEMAAWLGTNNYEVTTQISQRVPRFIRNGDIL